MKYLSIAVALAVSSPSFAGAPDQFDLACTGKINKRPSGEAGTFVPASWQLKVDLVSRTFCQDDCSVVEEIAQIMPEKIILLRKSGTDSGGVFDFSEISRSDGSYRRSTAVINVRSGPSADYLGNCALKEFTGFPRKLF